MLKCNDVTGFLGRLTQKNPKIVQQNLINSGLIHKIMQNHKVFGETVEVKHEYDGINFSVKATVIPQFIIMNEIHWFVHYDEIELLS